MAMGNNDGPVEIILGHVERLLPRQVCIALPV